MDDSGLRGAANLALDVAPTGVLRAGINYGNVVLAGRDPASGELSGVHVDLARDLARRLGIGVELAGHPAAGDLVEELKAGRLDIALLSTERSRAGDIVFSPPYVEIDATYLVPPGSRCRTAAEVDREGARIAITARSVYEFFLQRHLTRARLVSAPTTHAAYELFARDRLDALVGLRPRLVADAERMPGSRIVDGRFMVVFQSIATRRGRGAGARCVAEFIEHAHGSGLIAAALERHGVRGVSVASGTVR
jgi:polar amino acid transport system substrate-binding protein